METCYRVYYYCCGGQPADDSAGEEALSLLAGNAIGSGPRPNGAIRIEDRPRCYKCLVILSENLQRCRICNASMCGGSECSSTIPITKGGQLQGCLPCFYALRAQLNHLQSTDFVDGCPYFIEHTPNLTRVEVCLGEKESTTVCIVNVPTSSKLTKEFRSKDTVQVTTWSDAEKLWTESADTLFHHLKSSRVREEKLREEYDRLKAEHAVLKKSVQALESELDKLNRQFEVSKEHEEKLLVQVEELQQVKEEHGVLQQSVKTLEHDLANTRTTNKVLSADIHTLEERLATTTATMKEAEKRADALLARAGKGHIKRDWRRMNGAITFPAGDDLKEKFEVPFLQIESFFCDVITSLENMGHEEAQCPKLLVEEVLLPVHNATLAYVEQLLRSKAEIMRAQFGIEVPADLTDDTVPKLFWLMAMQTIVPGEVDALSEEVIAAMMSSMGIASAAHAQMLQDAQAGIIADTANDLRLNQLVRTMLRLFVYAKLSDPQCYLQPTPGTMVTYHPDRCLEVLSPGAKKHGLIKEGDRVQVVFAGLYFQDCTDVFDKVVPVVKCRVRRIVKQQ